MNLNENLLFIWFGRVGKEINDKLSKWKEYNDDGNDDGNDDVNNDVNIILWASIEHTIFIPQERRRYEIKYVEDLIDSTDELVSSIAKLVQRYLGLFDSIGTHAYCVASDVLRLLILYVDGGLYFDIDCVPGKIPMEWGHRYGFMYLQIYNENGGDTSTHYNFQPAIIGMSAGADVMRYTLDVARITSSIVMRELQEHSRDKLLVWHVITSSIGIIMNYGNDNYKGLSKGSFKDLVPNDISIYYKYIATEHKIVMCRQDGTPYDTDITIGCSFTPDKHPPCDKSDAFIKEMYDELARVLN